MFCISRSRAGYKKLHQKILFLAEVMNFFNLAHNTITLRVQSSNRDISKQLKEHFKIKPYKLEVSNLVVTFLTMIFYKLILGIFEKNRFLWPKMGLKMCRNQFFADISKSKGPGA